MKFNIPTFKKAPHTKPVAKEEKKDPSPIDTMLKEKAEVVTVAAVEQVEISVREKLREHKKPILIGCAVVATLAVIGLVRRTLRVKAPKAIVYIYGDNSTLKLA